jgi:F-type H+-transporting ATPase subunit delta
VFSNFCHVLVVEFLGLMAKDRSIHIIRQVIKAYSDLHKEKAGTIDVHAHVSQEMEVSYINTLQENLKGVINKNVDFKIEVDNDLVGGIKLRIENTFLDASLKSKLNRLQSKLLQS